MNLPGIKRALTLVFVGIISSLLLNNCERNEIEPDNTNIITRDTLEFIKYPKITFSLKEHILQDYFANSVDFDSDGNAWIGTNWDGLMKYNKIDTILFDSTNTDFIDNLTFWDIRIDKEDNIWLATTIGLIKFKGSSETLYNSLNSPLSTRVSHIEIDSAGLLWINAGNSVRGGIYSFDGSNTWSSFTYDDKVLPAGLMQGLAVDKSTNTTWFSLSTYVRNCYIGEIRNNTLNIYDSDDFGFTPYYMHDIALSKTKELLIINDYSISSNFPNPTPYVFKYSPAKCEACDFIDPISHKPLYCRLLRSDGQGDIWGAFFSEEGGFKIAVYNGNKWFSNSGMISIPRYVYDIGQHPNGNIWVCSSEGIYILDKKYKE